MTADDSDTIELITDLPYLRAQVLIARGRESLAKMEIITLRAQLEEAQRKLATFEHAAFKPSGKPSASVLS